MRWLSEPTHCHQPFFAESEIVCFHSIIGKEFCTWQPEFIFTLQNRCRFSGLSALRVTGEQELILELDFEEAGETWPPGKPRAEAGTGDSCPPCPPLGAGQGSFYDRLLGQKLWLLHDCWNMHGSIFVYLVRTQKRTWSFQFLYALTLVNNIFKYHS